MTNMFHQNRVYMTKHEKRKESCQKREIKER